MEHSINDPHSVALMSLQMLTWKSIIDDQGREKLTDKDKKEKGCHIHKKDNAYASWPK